MAAANKNTIVLRGDLRRWHSEKIANDANVRPGHLVELLSTDKVQRHSIIGGRHMRHFAKEDSLRGGTAQGTLQSPDNGVTVPTYYSSGDTVFIHRAQSGDHINALLAIGQSVVIGDWLMSAGDGTLIKMASTVYANIVAASTGVTNTTVETAFSNGSVVIPANSLQVGDVLRIRGQVVASATHSTDTLKIKVYLGTQALVDTGALDVANADAAEFQLWLTVRTIGASGTYICDGWASIGTPGTATAKVISLGSTAVDTTVAETIAVKATWSVADPGNICALQALTVEKLAQGSAGVGQPPAEAGTPVGQVRGAAVDLSAASAVDFVEIEVV